MYNSESNLYCAVCNLIPVFVSGVIGYWGGLLSVHMGLDQAFASTFAGFCGFMAVQTVQLGCTIVAHYYKGSSHAEPQ